MEYCQPILPPKRQKILAICGFFAVGMKEKKAPFFQRTLSVKALDLPYSSLA
jgi:hypothetical protein